MLLRLQFFNQVLDIFCGQGGRNRRCGLLSFLVACKKLLKFTEFAIFWIVAKVLKLVHLVPHSSKELSDGTCVF